MQLSAEDRVEVEDLMAQGVGIARASKQGSPLSRFWQQTAITNPDLLDTWAIHRPQGGLIARLGSGHVLITVMPRASLNALEERYGSLPFTVETVAPSGSRLLWFAAPVGLPSWRADDHVHLRSMGGAAQVPPTLGSDGLRFRWRHRPSSTLIAELPLLWAEAAREAARVAA